MRDNDNNIVGYKVACASMILMAIASVLSLGMLLFDSIKLDSSYAYIETVNFTIDSSNTDTDTTTLPMYIGSKSLTLPLYNSYTTTDYNVYVVNDKYGKYVFDSYDMFKNTRNGSEISVDVYRNDNGSTYIVCPAYNERGVMLK